MKQTCLILCCYLTMGSGIAQTMTAKQWLEDIDFLHQTVHRDYSFLFKKITTERFDAEVLKLKTQVPTLQDHEVIAGLTRLVALFGYGHTDVDWNGGLFKHARIPVNFYWFSDGIFIEGTHKDHAAAVGAKVLKVEGREVQEVLQAVRPLLNEENEQYYKAYILDFLGIPEALHAQKIIPQLKNNLTLTLEKGGKIFYHSFAAQPALTIPRSYGFTKLTEDWVSGRATDRTPNYLKNLDKIYYFEYLADNNTLYIRHSQIQDDKEESIAQFYARVEKFMETNAVEKLILDVRLNGGGNNYKNRDIVKTIIRSNINTPGKFIVIIGRRTFSACQNLVNELDKYTEAIFIGEPTSENINFYGDNRRVDLPHSKLPVYLSFAWWQDKPVWEDGPWKAPHVAAELSSADYFNNEDPVLTTALNFDGRNFIRDPMGHLEKLFNQGKVDEVKSEAQRMVNDARYKFFDFENAFNSAAIRLAEQKNFMPAGMVLNMCGELFPHSLTTWLNLAEINIASGSAKEAAKYLQKVIDINPESEQAKKAKELLSGIQEKK